MTQSTVKRSVIEEDYRNSVNRASDLQEWAPGALSRGGNCTIFFLGRTHISGNLLMELFCLPLGLVGLIVKRNGYGMVVRGRGRKEVREDIPRNRGRTLQGRKRSTKSLVRTIGYEGAG